MPRDLGNKQNADKLGGFPLTPSAFLCQPSSGCDPSRVRQVFTIRTVCRLVNIFLDGHSSSRCRSTSGRGSTSEEEISERLREVTGGSGNWDPGRSGSWLLVRTAPSPGDSRARACLQPETGLVNPADSCQGALPKFASQLRPHPQPKQTLARTVGYRPHFPPRWTTRCIGTVLLTVGSMTPPLDT